MRFMMLVKHLEPSAQPPQGFLDAMTKFNEDAAKAGIVVSAGGLGPTSQSSRVRLSHGELNVIDGPFAEAKEVVGGFAVLDFPSREAAIQGATDFMTLHKKYWPGWEGETEVRQVFGPETTCEEAFAASR